MLFWALLLILIIIAYALILIWVLPKFVLKTKYSIASPSDRGLKKYKMGESDYAIVYEPSLSARKYVTQYILAKRDGQKIFKCKISQDITYIDFDIALFDAQEKCFSVINSMEIVSNDGFTPEIELPAETAFASIIINQVNDKELHNTQVAHVSKKRVFAFGILSLLLSVGMSVCCMLSFSNLFGGIFRETFAEKMLLSGWVFIFPTIISTVVITLACCTLFLKNSKR